MARARKRGELGKQLRELIAAENERRLNDPMWWVRLDAPATRIFCTKTQGKESIGTDVPLVAALVRDRIGFSVSDTDRADVRCVEVEMVSTFAVPESFMAGFMQAIRANDLHGEYWKCIDKDKHYKF